jgi:Linalool dehydratase/isomerase
MELGGRNTNTIGRACTILAEFEMNEFLGVCCEPNCIFLIWNRFPLMAIPYNDVKNGTKVTSPGVGKVCCCLGDERDV